MSDNWVVQNLENALNTWNEKLAEIWQLVTQSPEQFKGGTIWSVTPSWRCRLRIYDLARSDLFLISITSKKFIHYEPLHPIAIKPTPLS